jgi:hypothetical protein
MRQERDPAFVDPRAEQLEHRRQHRDGPHDCARDDRDRPARNPVEDVEAEHEHACHGDRDSRAGHEDGPA